MSVPGHTLPASPSRQPAPQVQSPAGDADGIASTYWLLRKNCSFSPRQVLAFYLSLTLVSFAIAGFFALKGLWMVLPFAVLDNLVLAAALLYYARHALDRECISLQGDELCVEHVNGAQVIRHCFNARWVRLEWRGRGDDKLWLCHASQSLPVGIYLTPARRRRFAHELRKAIRASMRR